MLTTGVKGPVLEVGVINVVPLKACFRVKVPLGKTLSVLFTEGRRNSNEMRQDGGRQDRTPDR